MVIPAQACNGVYQTEGIHSRSRGDAAFRRKVPHGKYVVEVLSLMRRKYTGEMERIDVYSDLHPSRPGRVESTCSTFRTRIRVPLSKAWSAVFRVSFRDNRRSPGKLGPPICARNGFSPIESFLAFSRQISRKHEVIARWQCISAALKQSVPGAQ